MISAPSPVATLAIAAFTGGRPASDLSEPVHGGYANARGEIFLFAGELVYRVNFKSQILQRRPPLNPQAQARYDATAAGEQFEYASKTFRRLSHEQIAEICASHRFRISSSTGYV